jgi:hypothetical protein
MPRLTVTASGSPGFIVVSISVFDECVWAVAVVDLNDDAPLVSSLGLMLQH